MLAIHDKPQLLIGAHRAAKSFRHARFEAFAFSQRSPGKTSSNEDSSAMLAVGRDSMIAIVADGCGGMRGGEQASAIAVRTLVRVVRRYLRQTSNAESLRSIVMDGIDRANEAIQELRIGAACTIAVVECTENRIRPYHVGDSMILVANARQGVRYQSLSHSPVGYAVEAGMLSERAALVHQDRHLISNYLGTPSMRIEVGSWIELQAEDRVVVASDGLFDNLRTAEIVRRLQFPDVSTSVTRLARLARSRMENTTESNPSKPDDLSIISLRVRANEQP